MGKQSGRNEKEVIKNELEKMRKKEIMWNCKLITNVRQFGNICDF